MMWPGAETEPLRSSDSSAPASRPMHLLHSFKIKQKLFFSNLDDVCVFMFQAILNTHPYHIDSLLQLSEICKMGEDYQMAAELIGDWTIFAIGAILILSFG